MLEGIALVGNPEFALVDEAYPYLAKRLLTDESPRLRAALRYMIYGKEGVFDAERLIDILMAFETFAVNSKSALGDGRDLSTGAPAAESNRAASGNGASSSGQPAFPVLPFPLFPFPPPPTGLFPPPPFFPFPPSPFAAPGMRATPAAAQGTLPFPPNPFLPFPAAPAPGAAVPSAEGVRTREALRFMFSDQGKFFREFIMEELARSVDALSRDQARQVVVALGLESVLVPVLLPGAKPFVPLAPVVTEEDRKVVANITKIVAFLLGGDASRLASMSVDPRVAAELAPFLPTLATEILPDLFERLSSRLVARAIRDLYTFEKA